MVIQFLGGGLGNQIMEYTLGRYIQRRNPRHTLCFDDSCISLNLNTSYRNGYELKKVFGIHVTLMSELFDAEMWKKICLLREKRVFLQHILWDAGVPIVQVYGGHLSNSFFPGINIDANFGVPEQSPNLCDLPYRNIYSFGLGGYDYTFEQDQEENRKELSFPPLRDEKNLTYAAQINDSMSVGIHVRRGDFLKWGYMVPKQGYLRACQNVLDRYPDARFFVVSDGLDWCKANAKSLGFDLAAHTVYVEGNNIEGRNYIDMQLLSMCRGIVRPERSTFARVAGWLNPHLEFEIKLNE